MSAFSRKNGAFVRRVALLMLLLLLCAILLERNLTQVILTLASARARVMAVQALNEAVDEVVNAGVRYEDLITVTFGDTGGVRLLQSNTAGMNALASRAALLAQAKLSALEAQSVSVPLGSALGVALLSGVGPRVRVQLLPVGTVLTAYETEFTSAGINQTRHRVLLTMTAQVQLILPTGASAVQASNQVAVAESIIIGDVPESFVNVGDDSDLLNLVP